MSASASGSLVVIGRGRVGRTLAARAKDAGLVVRLLPGRTLATSRAARTALASASIVWLAVPDPSLVEVDRALAAHLVARQGAARVVVAHASGASSPSILAACAACGAHVASAHPAVSFGTTATRLEGTSVVVHGDAVARRRLASLVRRLGARPILQPLHGPRYHAALALAANGTAALAALATRWLSDPRAAALSEVEATRLLASLLRSVADNVGRVGAAQALTGPIARGDAAAVERHLAALSPEERRAYVAVSRLVLLAAHERGLEPAKERAIAAVLDAPVAPTPRRSRQRATR